MQDDCGHTLPANSVVADPVGWAGDKNESSMAQSGIVDELSVFRRIVDQAPDAIIVSDRHGMIRTWNLAAEILLGYRADEAIGQSLDIIIPEHLRGAHWAGFRRAVASGVTKHGGQALRTRATHKSGEPVYLSLAFSVVKDEEGNVMEVMATARDSKP